MKHIINVRVEIIEQDEDGTTYRSDLTSPTIELMLEKVGAFERSRDRRNEWDMEKQAEDLELNNVYTGRELEEDKLATIEK